MKLSLNNTSLVKAFLSPIDLLMLSLTTHP